MAERRMFAKTIIDSDVFLDMPTSARLLYYDLSMRADDDGFVNSPKKITRITGATSDDIKVLIAKKFIIPFESGVVVIKHWKIHNYIRKDTYNETNYKEEKATLALDENNAYTQRGDAANTELLQSRGRAVDEPSTQVRLGKDRLGKDSKEKSKKKNLLDDVPDELKEDVDVFMEMRKKMRAPMTDRALTMMLKKVNDLSGGNMEKSKAIIEQSVINGWKGVFPLKENKQKAKTFADLLEESYEQRRDT